MQETKSPPCQESGRLASRARTPSHTMENTCEGGSSAARRQSGTSVPRSVRLLSDSVVTDTLARPCAAEPVSHSRGFRTSGDCRQLPHLLSSCHHCVDSEHRRAQLHSVGASGPLAGRHGQGERQQVVRRLGRQQRQLGWPRERVSTLRCTAAVSCGVSEPIMCKSRWWWALVQARRARQAGTPPRPPAARACPLWELSGLRSP